jgi:3-methylcrotonyl-CoA carboxylase alpha subunit
LEADGESADFEILENSDGNIVVLTASRRIAGRVYRRQDTFDLFADGEHATLSLIDPLAYNQPIDEAETQLTAPMPGRIVAVLVQAGQSVVKGTPLIVMEAMKMEHTIVALSDGRVDEVFVKVSDQVPESAQLLHFIPTTPSK